MYKGLCKFLSRWVIIVCLSLLWIGIPVSASEMPSETNADEKIYIDGLGAVSVTDIKDIQPARTRSACGLFHTWQVSRIVQEGDCITEAVAKVVCSECGATGTVYSDAPGHNYVSDICSLCGDQKNSEVAPATELAKWDYTLDSTEQTIQLTQYKGAANDVIVYGSYDVNGTIYNTILNGVTFDLDNGPFYNKRDTLTSVVIKDGVVSTSCHELFYQCTSLTSVDLSGLDTSNVSIMLYMFGFCKNLTDLDLAGINTSNVIDMGGMFAACESLVSLDLGNFDTSNCIYLNDMFYGCYSLTGLDVSSFDTSNAVLMNMMFADCRSLLSIDLSNFDTSKVSYLASFFEGCSNLISADISNFTVAPNGTLARMFLSCYNLTTVNMNNINTTNAVSMKDMFGDCFKLKTLDLTSIDTYNMTDMSSAFYNCYELTTIYVNRYKWNTTFADTTSMFYNCGTSRVTPVV
ncbi:MAG: DUF285 domain-containing protein [Lachnospiraceae bacterium]|nr:DUF285 domain-containing protein [Lachnospiraceae bacterium]